MRIVGRSARILSAATLMACSSGADRAANDSGVARDSLRVDTAVTVLRFTEWAPVAGRHLLVAAGAPDTALVVFPEFTIDSTLSSAPLTVSGDALVDYSLFSPDGSVTTGRLTPLIERRQPGCDGWPVGYLSTSSSERRPWTIGLRAGRGRPIPYLALDRYSSRDSARLVVDLTRLASQAPNDTLASFRGLPYVVRTAYSVTLADSQSLVFGELVRRVNIEASPHEERVTVIGERPLAAGTSRYVLAYSERHAGDEESVPTMELIGLVELRDGTVAAFGAREFSDGGTFVMFERNRSGRWRLRWQSAYAGC